MKEKFISIFESFDLDKKEIEKLFLRLTSMYSFENRYYHCLTHIKNILGELDRVWERLNHSQFFFDKDKIRNYRILYLASWFHDAIYDPLCNQNEINSADFAATELQSIQLPDKETKIICELILSTISHKPIVDEGVCKLFLDLDLSILGQSPDVYEEYCKNIRREYSFVLDSEYRERRSEKLREFLNRDLLFFTDNFYEKYENQARLNLHNEIERLALA